MFMLFVVKVKLNKCGTAKRNTKNSLNLIVYKNKTPSFLASYVFCNTKEKPFINEKMQYRISTTIYSS